ncbi:MAG: hypothetical protein ACXW1S_03735 [Acidimicrobiia bacterium]
MLTGPDETLRHQLPTTFDHVGTSDPRFYDRYFFGVHDPDGRLSLHIGLGLYTNMNVMDGYVAALVPHRPDASDPASNQHNLRLSRALRPDIDTIGIGSYVIEILEPFRRARVSLPGGEHPVALDLEWTATAPAKEEEHHFRRLRGRVAADYHRYTIVGEASGWVDVAGRRFEVDHWFGARDHSWGVREQVAGPEPVTGPPGFGMEQVGYVFSWVPFQCGDLRGHVQLQTLGDGTVIYRDGILHHGGSDEAEAVVDVAHEVDFHPGTRQFSQIRATWTTAAGRTLDVVVEPLLRPFSMDGTGYDWGFADGQGLGVYRGEYHVESDVYDLTDPEVVIRPDGEVRRPMHRETPVRITVDGQAGIGHQVVVVSGPVPVLGLS